MEETNALAQVIGAALPAITAVIGFIGGLIAVDLSERRRRETAIRDRRREATLKLVHELYATVELDMVNPAVYNSALLRIEEAGIALELEHTGKAAAQFASWFNDRTSQTYELADKRTTHEELSASTADINDFTRRLSLLYRGAITMKQLSMPPAELPD